MNNLSQLFIYPTTEIFTNSLDMSSDIWVQDPVSKWNWSYGKYSQIDSSNWASLTLPTTSLVNGKKYRVQYKLTGAKSTCKHFISCKAVGSSMYNYGSGLFTVEVTAKSNGMPIFDNRFYFAILADGKVGATLSNIRIWQVDEYELELSDNTTIPLNFAIAEIQDISKRSTSYSKTIVLPGSPKNNISLKHSYKVQNDLSFKFNYPVRCRLFNDSIEIFSGDMYLQNIKMDNEDQFITYDVDLRNTINTLFKVTAEKKLRGNDNLYDDLDFSEWDHTLNYTNIYQSWYKGSELRAGCNNLPTLSAYSNELGKGFVYPLINYGYTTAVTGASGVSTNYIRVEDMKPALFIKEIWDKIFANAGYTYTSTFLESDRFKRLLYPRHTTYEVGKEGVANRNYTIKNTKRIAGGNGDLQIDHVNSNRPEESQEIEVIAPWTVPASGSYDINVDVRYVAFQVKLTNDSSVGASIRDAGMQPDQRSSYWANLDFTLQRYSQDTASWIDAAPIVTHTPETLPPGLQPWTNKWWPYSTAQVYQTIDSSGTKLIAGDKLRVVAKMRSPHKNATGKKWNSYKDDLFHTDLLYSISGDIAPNGITMVIKGDASSSLAEGDNVDMNFCLPIDIKQSDFLLSIIKMFNLYIDVDKSNPLNLLIETRDDFYTNGITQDWTQERDFDAQFMVEQASDLNNKNIDFKWTTDTDAYNVDYTNATTKGYGENFITADLTTLETTEVTSGMIFAPSVMDTFSRVQNKNAIIVPQMLNKDTNGNLTSTTYKPRILYWAGLQYWDNNGHTANAIWTLTSLADGEKIYKLPYSNFYPYAGHSNVAPITGYTPTFDLNWGNNWWYYWGCAGGSYTYNNLVSTYYEKMLTEITDQGSKKVTAYINLTSKDIQVFSFKNQIIIDNVYYRVNSIIDYVPNQVTKVELLKLNYLETGTVNVNTKWNRIWDDIHISSGDTPLFPRTDGGSLLSSNNISQWDRPFNEILGNDNFIGVSARNNKIIGDNNYIGAEVINSSILNSDNVSIAPGLYNVSVINTDGVKVTESNVAYVNGQKFKDGLVIPKIDVVSGGIDEVQNAFSPVVANVIVGGIDENRKLGSASNSNLVQG